ncbi:hypothetical protein AMTR_s00038p00209110 [Amborella trichopoda]|uniref:U2A'/phosphoprotein 32 family A C-terminal domain-containing protein n=1 Tax=Amborella trichopoda TaxID=13333 RepID=U5CXI3_AMBTC|nr:hypothetical protein AMTR_s00038p00209110 [Amborella trichopoda]
MQNPATVFLITVVHKLTPECCVLLCALSTKPRGRMLNQDPKSYESKTGNHTRENTKGNASSTGLSNCTLIKELYLAGNKISDVEGLHRLLKLTVLDLSFNKITTAKALGQLVANYNSLQALNLLGNPIQANMGEESLRRAVSNLLPQLTFLNKQAIKPLRTREVAMDTVAKAALGSNSGGWHSRRKPIRRISSQQGLVTSARSSRRRGGSSSRKHEKGGNVGHEALSSHRRLRVSS